MIPLTWTLLAVVGLVISALALREATRVYMAHSGITNGRRATALVGFVSEIIRVLIYLAFLGVGVYFLYKGYEVSRIEIAAVFLAVEFLTIVKTSLNLWLIRYLVKSELHRMSESDVERNAREDLVMGEQRREIEDSH